MKLTIHTEQTEAITLTDAELEAVHGGYGGDCTPPPPCGGGAPSYYPSYGGSPSYSGYPSYGGSPSYSGYPSYSGSPYSQGSPFDSGSSCGGNTTYNVTTYYMGAPAGPSACGGY